PIAWRCDLGLVISTWKCSTSERRLCRRNLRMLASDARGPARGRPAARTASWGEVSEGGRSPPPSGTYREYASRAAVGRRLAAGPFSSLWQRVLRQPSRLNTGLLDKLRGLVGAPNVLGGSECRPCDTAGLPRQAGAFPG